MRILPLICLVKAGLFVLHEGSEYCLCVVTTCITVDTLQHSVGPAVTVPRGLPTGASSEVSVESTACLFPDGAKAYMTIIRATECVAAAHRWYIGGTQGNNAMNEAVVMEGLSVAARRPWRRRGAAPPRARWSDRRHSADFGALLSCSFRPASIF